MLSNGRSSRAHFCAASFCLVLLTGLTEHSLSAQGGPALRGLITDTTGGVIVGATVDVDDGAGHQAQATTDARGQYEFATLPAGTYGITVTFPGFAASERAVEVRAAGPTRADVTLEVVLDEQVDVTSHVSLQDSPLTRTLTRQELALLPDDSRRLLQRLREMAGTRGRRRDVVIYVDGFREGTRVPPKSRIQMIRISAHPFSAEFQEAGSARVEITTRPGAEKVTADLGLTFNSDQLTSREYFAPQRPDSQLLHYTGYLASPVVRNRLSFSAFVGRWEEDISSVYNATVLDPATLEPKQASGAVVAPTRIDSVLAGVNTLAGKKHTVMLLYGYEQQRADNQGIDTAFDLPDRVYSRTSRELSGRGSLLSILSPTLLNDVHLEIGRRESGRLAQFRTPTTFVLDAFRAGGNQNSLSLEERSDNLQVRETLTFARGAHTLKAGLQAEAADRSMTDRSGFGGSFVFGADVERDETGEPLLDSTGQTVAISPLERYRRTLAGLPGYGPSQYSLVTGDAGLSVRQWWLSWFAQDDWTPSPRLTISLGLRHDWQSYVDERADIAGRLGVGWTVDSAGNNIVRGGAGLFYERLGPDIALDTERYDGNRRLEFVVTNPPFYLDVPPVDQAPPAALHQKGPDMKTPSTLVATASYERKLPWNLTAMAEYTHEDGRRLLLRRNVNVPGPDGVRPVPERGPILQYDSVGASKSDDLLVSLRLNANRLLTLTGGYGRTWSRATTDGHLTSPADPNNLGAEWAMPADDREHRGHLGGTLYLPWHIYVSPYFTASSGRPFNITTGRDSNGDTLYTERPSFAGIDDPNVIVTALGRFTLVPGPEGAVVPRNLGRGEPEYRLDLHVSKVTNLGGGVKLTLACDMQNALNAVTFSQYNTVVTSPLVGEPNRTLPPRRVLLTGRISY